MAFDGSGVFNRPVSAYIYDTVISETDVNTEMDGMATGLSNCITKDGQQTITANIPMNSKKFTGLVAGSAATDSVTLGQAQAEAFIWCGTMTGTADAGVLTPSPAIPAYAAGQRFVWISSANANTTAMTIAISGLSAIAAQNDGAALAAGDHAASKLYVGILNTTSTIQIQRVFTPSAFIQTLMNDADAATALATLGITIGVASGNVPTVNQAETSTASATATTLGTTLKHLITGTTTITSFSGVAGVTYHCTAGGAFLLTHNATNLDILQTGADITTAADDTFDVYMRTTTTAEIRNYQRADGTALVSSSAGIVLGTQVATTTGTAFDYSGFPAGTKRIVILFDGNSLSGTDNITVQIGDAGGLETTGYVAGSGIPGVVGITSTSSFPIRLAFAASACHGRMVLDLMDEASFKWNSWHGIYRADSTTNYTAGGGTKSLSATLTQLRISRDGTDAFDAGSINVTYE